MPESPNFSVAESDKKKNHAHFNAHVQRNSFDGSDD
jgi:hypothetical protein